MAGKLVNIIRKVIPIDFIKDILLSRLYGFIFRSNQRKIDSDMERLHCKFRSNHRKIDSEVEENRLHCKFRSNQRKIDSDVEENRLHCKFRSNQRKIDSEVEENRIQVEGKFIPTDVIEAVLSKLPVKTLIRFQTLSKSCKTIISNPYFSKINCNHLSRSHDLLLCDMEDMEEQGFCAMRLDGGAKLHREAELGAPFGSAVPLSSCNGIVLLAPWKTPCGGFVLWNPSIRRHAIIPIPLPDIGWMNAGIYHDSRTDDYKVAIISVDRNQVFSCKTGTWTNTALVPINRSTIFGVVDGRLYWQVNGEIRCFDFRERKRGKLKPPEKMIGQPKLAKLWGRLCLLLLDGEGQVWIRDHGWKEVSNFLKTGVHFIDTLVDVLLEGDMAVYADYCSCLLKYDDCEKRFRLWEIPTLLLPYGESLFFPETM